MLDNDRHPAHGTSYGYGIIDFRHPGPHVVALRPAVDHILWPLCEPRMGGRIDLPYTADFYDMFGIFDVLLRRASAAVYGSFFFACVSIYVPPSRCVSRAREIAECCRWWMS